MQSDQSRQSRPAKDRAIANGCRLRARDGGEKKDADTEAEVKVVASAAPRASLAAGECNVAMAGCGLAVFPHERLPMSIGNAPRSPPRAVCSCDWPSLDKLA